MKKFIWVLLISILAYIGASYFYNDYFSRSIVLSPQKANPMLPCHPLHSQDTSPSTIRILVVDGGGMDGIMPLVVLRYLEEKTGKPIAELFDFFTGTSTGSIIVSTLNEPDAAGLPKFTAEELLELYKNFSKQVLSPPLLRRIFTLNGLFGPHLSVQNLHEKFVYFMGEDVTFGHLIKRVAITAYDIERERLVILNNWECKKPISRYLAADVITAATATPTFFAPVIYNDYNQQKRTVLVDGMIFANNPSLDAVREGFKLYPHAKKFIIVHLGTGGESLGYLRLNANKMQHWGFLHWIPSMLTILYKSQNTIIQDAITSIQDFSPNTEFNYYLFNKNLYNPAPFDTSEANIKDIETNANDIIKEQKQALDALADELRLMAH